MASIPRQFVRLRQAFAFIGGYFWLSCPCDKKEGEVNG
jgi:hypothetical protein